MMEQSIIEKGLLHRKKKAIIVTIVLFILTITLCLLTLTFGKEVFSLDTVFNVIFGNDKNFSISRIRLPKMIAGLLVGFSLGISGNTFQTILRNNLASPDVIGISTSTSAAGVFCILVLGLSGASVSLISTVFGLIVATLIYYLSRKDVFNNNRLILIGIGMQIMMNAFISYIVLKASEYDIPKAMRWLNGSLNGIQMKSIPSLFIITIIFSAIIIFYEKDLKMMELGEELSITLGVKVHKVRLILIVSSVFLIAFSTSVTGPISFIAFLAGPISKHLVGSGSKNILISGMVGASLVLLSEMIGQFAFSYRYPVGVITGILGAPYLLLLLLKMNKKGAV